MKLKKKTGGGVKTHHPPVFLLGMALRSCESPEGRDDIGPRGPMPASYPRSEMTLWLMPFA